MKCAVFASGNGSNFQALVEAFSNPKEGVEISFLFSDHKDAYALTRAENLGIKFFAFSPQDFKSREDYEEALVTLCQKEKVDYILLAGYMRLIYAPLLEAFPHRIINIHPSLLPAFPGRTGIKDALKAGVKETGVTVHYVNEEIDSGEILSQVKVAIEEDDDLDSLAQRIHQAEHRLYASVVRQLSQAKGSKK
ncbi:phosphoribosylglycinamide formyltransferase [Aerococcus christensenii]|uniref:phosphoribosylglycinamide formyltransferase n=1 Tax=Aerococcus christensenii TaxID=87541 RepID=UPI0023A9A378|nr:phosphoribosylglycinamide formyltransferase [Aerococcus christensenii]WEB70516.1 phosphoribosylglycinamide formyltransferase [Aerococcus christensenii]